MALAHAIRAAELYMRAAGEAVNRTDASRLRRKCHELIALAERVKAQLAAGPSIIPLAASSAVPSAELGILWRTSRLHGNDFPLWEADPADAEFELQPGAQLFTCVLQST